MKSKNYKTITIRASVSEIPGEIGVAKIDGMLYDYDLTDSQPPQECECVPAINPKQKEPVVLDYGCPIHAVCSPTDNKEWKESHWACSGCENCLEDKQPSSDWEKEFDRHWEMKDSSMEKEHMRYFISEAIKTARREAYQEVLDDLPQPISDERNKTERYALANAGFNNAISDVKHRVRKLLEEI